MNKAQAMQAMAPLAGILFEEPFRSKVWDVTFGEPGQVAQHLDEETKQNIALILIDRWLVAERIQPGSESEVLANHKHVYRHSKLHFIEIGTEVQVLPNGGVALFVAHLLGFGDIVDLARVNHCIVSWNAETQRWVVAQFDGMLKISALDLLRKGGQLSAESAQEALCKLKPWKTKEYGRLDNALEEARHYARLGLVIVRELQPTREARQEFSKIPALTNLDPNDDDMLEAALEMVEDIPSIFDLQSMAAQRNAN